MSNKIIPIPESNDPKVWDAWLKAEEKAKISKRSANTRKQNPEYNEEFYSNKTTKIGNKFKQSFGFSSVRSVKPEQDFVEFDNKPFTYTNPFSKANRQKKRRNKNNWKRDLAFKKTAAMIKAFIK